MTSAALHDLYTCGLKKGCQKGEFERKIELKMNYSKFSIDSATRDASHATQKPDS